MTKRLKIYLDTSVPNAYMDDKNPFRKEITREFWNKLKDYEVFVSDIVIKEIEDIGDTARRKDLLGLISEFRKLSSDENEIKALSIEPSMI